MNKQRICTKLIRRKSVQVKHVERPINNLVQVFISPQVAAIVHSKYWQVALASIYIIMYICTLSKSQVSQVLQIAQFPLRTRRWSHYYHRRARNKLQWQTLQHLLDVLRGLAILDLCSERTWTATSLPRHYEGRSLRNQLETSAFTGVPGCRIDTKSKKNVFTCTSGVRNAISLCLCFCCTNNRIIISFLRVQMNQNTQISIFCWKRGVYELILWYTNYQKFYSNPKLRTSDSYTCKVFQYGGQINSIAVVIAT